jgi:hypothetical protein
MALDHEGARRLMAVAIEGQLSADEERELAVHMVGCPDCKQIYEGLQQAHPALSAIELGRPSEEALEAAVHRAITVLRGEADPGPMGLTEEPPRLPDDDPNTVRIDTSFDEVHAPVVTPEPRSSFDVTHKVPEAHVRAIEPEIVESIVSEPEPISLEPEPFVDESDAPEIIDIPSGPRISGGLPDFEAPTPAPVVPVPAEPRSEIETLLDEDRTRFEPLPYEEDDDDLDSLNVSKLLMAIAFAVVLAVLAGILVFRGQSLFGGGGDLPSSEEVRNRVTSTFKEMKSLKASFVVQKLNLYRIGREENSLVYNFSNGKYDGRITYDRAEGYKETFTLAVKSDQIERADIVQTSDETRSVIGSGADKRLLVEQNPPLGPPDGNLRPRLGVLEDSLGGAARLIAGARDLQVAGKISKDGRELYEIRGNITPTGLSRADRIEAALDANNFLPVIVKRSISRSNARVLGPEAALSEADLDRAFANHDRVTTELVELSDVMYDDIVLPNDLVLEAAEGTKEQRTDSKFERVTRAELGSQLDYEPLLPRTLPGGYEEGTLANYTGEPQGWGPNDVYPKPTHVFHSEYFDGRTTIVVTQRLMPARFDLQGSPLARAGLPITVRTVVKDNKTFFVGTSPEVPAHAYGFLGNTFVMAVGYAPQSELVDLIASLAQTPADVPSLDTSPSPSGSPGASPASSPLATASPVTTPVATPASTGSLPD